MTDSKEQIPSSEASGASQVPAESTTVPTTSKSKNAEKNEAKRQEKLAKFAAKKAKLMAAGNVISEFFLFIQFTNSSYNFNL